jgi:acyl-CoA thioester hydrolase
MNQMRIFLPKIPDYSTKLTIRITDINYGGHLGNDTVLRFCHEVRVRYFQLFGFDELHFFTTSLIMRDAAIVYKAQGHQGDTLLINLYIGEVGPISFEVLYKLTNQKTNQEIARAKTLMVFYDYQKQKIQKMPKDFCRDDLIKILS